MPKIYANDIEIYYEIQGDGPNLLFISGTGGDLRNKPNILDSPLINHFRVLARPVSLINLILWKTMLMIPLVYWKH